MSEASIAPLRTWLAAPMDHDVSEAIERLRRAPDVEHIAVMPDVHLSADVCIGVVVATSCLIYPQAVGGGIGCGMLAVGLDLEASALDNPGVAGQVMADLSRAVPARRRNRRAIITQPDYLASDTHSHPVLEAVRRSEGAIEFATLGSGNHFIELQADEEHRLWLMVHSGSRAPGQAIRNHHRARGQPVDHRLRVLDAQSDAGVEYLHDASYARRFAEASRRAMAEQVGQVLERRLGAHVCWETDITTDHNHISQERHGGRELWVHRKGAMPARLGERGVPVLERARRRPGIEPYSGPRQSDRTGASPPSRLSGRAFVNGNREQTNNFLLDGVDVNETVNNRLGYTPSVDALEEVQVMTGNGSSEFGNSAGAVVNMTIKSGTNSFHGTLFEFFRNDNLDANTFFANQNTALAKDKQRRTFQQNQYGFTFGGPVLIPGVLNGKDKLFFFANWEGTQRRDSGPSLASVARADWRAGDLSRLPQTILDPATCSNAAAL